MTATRPHKQGDTFTVTGEIRIDKKPQNLDGWKIRSQIRKNNKLVETLTVTHSTEFLGVYEVTSALTTWTWPLGDLSFDVEYTNTQGQVVTTETAIIRCIAKVTQPELVPLPAPDPSGGA